MGDVEKSGAHSDSLKLDPRSRSGGGQGRGQVGRLAARTTGLGPCWGARAESQARWEEPGLGGGAVGWFGKEGTGSRQEATGQDSEDE